MSLATLSSTTSLGYQPSYQPTNSGNANNKNASVVPENDLLSPEQKNTLQHSADAKLTEQAENIKSNYQSAKDLDLTRAYYQQQQKLIDIYMKTSTTNDTEKNNVNNTSAVSTLTDTYAALYTLHKNISEGNQQLPSIPDEVAQPIHTQSATLPVQDNMSSAKKQMDTYNSLMMPSNSSYLHLSA